MDMQISNKTAELLSGSSVIRKLFEEGREMARSFGAENVYDFSLGNPNVEPPAAVAESIRRLVGEKNQTYLHGYMKNAGYDEVRAAVAASLNRRFGTAYGPEHIVMTVGAGGGLNCLMNTFLNPDDEVLCFAPFFGEYRSYAKNYYGRLVVVPALIDSMRLNLDAMDAYISEKTKLILLNNPNNPSGVIYTREELEHLAALIQAAEARIGHRICVVSDEPYRELAYDGAEVPYMPLYVPNCIVCYSFSKTLSIPGERIGYLAVPPEMENARQVLDALVVSNRSLGYVNAPSLFQLVVADCLEEKVDIESYDCNRRLLYDSLTRLGFSCIKPQGAFYMLVKAPDGDAEAFVEAGKKEHIIMVSTRSFGCPGYVRLAYCVPYKMIERSLPAFERLAVQYFG